MDRAATLAALRKVYDHSARLFVDSVGTEVSPRFESPIDRALLDAYAETVRTRPPGRVLDVGCGPGRIAAYLSRRGLDTAGVDVSPGMIEAARSAHPHIQFDVNPLTALGVADRSLAGAVYWYSIIATDPHRLPAVWRELDRVLRTDGIALVAFPSGGGEAIEQQDAYGSGAPLTLYRHSIEEVAGSLAAAGLGIHAEAHRGARFPHESAPQAILFIERGGPGEAALPSKTR